MILYSMICEQMWVAYRPSLRNVFHGLRPKPFTLLYSPHLQKHHSAIRNFMVIKFIAIYIYMSTNKLYNWILPKGFLYHCLQIWELRIKTKGMYVKIGIFDLRHTNSGGIIEIRIRRDVRYDRLNFFNKLISFERKKDWFYY